MAFMVYSDALGKSLAVYSLLFGDWRKIYKFHLPFERISIVFTWIVKDMANADVFLVHSVCIATNPLEYMYSYSILRVVNMYFWQR